MLIGHKTEANLTYSKHFCDTCGRYFEICPPSDTWKNCMAKDCPSYDLDCDLDLLFDDNEEVDVSDIDNHLTEYKPLLRHYTTVMSTHPTKGDKVGKDGLYIKEIRIKWWGYPIMIGRVLFDWLKGKII